VKSTWVANRPYSSVKSRYPSLFRKPGIGGKTGGRFIASNREKKRHDGAVRDRGKKKQNNPIMADRMRGWRVAGQGVLA